MEPLKTIWREQSFADSDPLVLTPLPDFSRLAEEERRREKWMPYTNGFIGLMLICMGVFYYWVGALSSGYGWLGFFLVILSALSIAYCTQIARLPARLLRHEKSAAEFAREVGAILRRRIIALGVGLAIQNVTLAVGVYLMIRGASGPWTGGATGLWFGVWLGLGGLTVGLAVAAYRRHYREELALADSFSEDGLL